MIRERNNLKGKDNLPHSWGLGDKYDDVSISMPHPSGDFIGRMVYSLENQRCMRGIG